MNAVPSARSKRSQQKQAVARQRADNRDARWAANRFSVPYALDGPKVLLGVGWFVVLLGLFLVDARLSALLVVPVVAVAGLQTAFAWSGQEAADRRVAALVAAAIVLAGLVDGRLLGVAVIVGVVLCLADAAAVGITDPTALLRFGEIMVRASIPVGVAGGSLLLLATDAPEVFVALVLLISAYEAGDFLVGSGADNAIEGPLAGLLAVAVVGAGLTLVQPYPLDANSMPIFAALAAVCCPLGQLLASALLPHGTAWAPALRRLDSYLVAAPIWWLALPILDAPR